MSPPKNSAASSSRKRGIATANDSNGAPNKKNKPCNYGCECGHLTQDDCDLGTVEQECHEQVLQKQERINDYLQLTRRIIACSEIVDICVLEMKRRRFQYRKISSQYTRDISAPCSTKITKMKGLISLKSSQSFSPTFGHGFTLASSSARTSSVRDHIHSANWEFGKFIKSAWFRNFCVGKLADVFEYDNVSLNFRDRIEHIESVYELCDSRFQPRKLVADWMNCYNPFRKFKEGSDAWVAYKALLQKYPDLASDMAKASGKEGAGTHSADNQHRAAYMEEPDLVDIWVKELLARRTRSEVEEAAKSRSIQGVLELDAIEPAELVQED